MSYTPGPWGQSGSYLYHHNGNHSVPMAHVISDFKSLDERDANARLIAAAPDLLDVLQKVTKYGYLAPNDSTGQTMYQFRVALLDQATAAIAKALGN